MSIKKLKELLEENGASIFSLLRYTLAHVLESFFRVPAISITTLNLFGEQIRMYTTILNENEIKESCELL